MKKTLSILLITMLAALFAACPSGTDTNTNANGNTEEQPKTVADAVMEVDDTFSAANLKKDGKFFEANVADNFIGVNAGGFFDKAMTVKYIADNPCEGKSNPPTDRKVTEMGEGVALVTGKGSGERTCDGETTKSADNYAVLFVKDGETWKAAYYQNIQTMEEKVGPADDAKKEGDKPAADAEAKKEEPAADAAKTEEKPAAEEKKEEAPMTPKFQNDEEIAKALAAIENDLWAAWAKKDAKPFEDVLAADFQDYSAEGIMDRAAALKSYTEHKCEVTSSALSDTNATKINDNLVIFSYKAVSKGTCEGKPMPDAPAYVASIWKKEGDSWKAVFHMMSQKVAK